MNSFYHNPNIGNQRKNEYAVVIFLPRELDEVILPLREKFDPDYNLVDSHVTVVFPFASEKPLDEIATAIRAETIQQEPLELELETLDDFYPDYPIIYWIVKENDRLTHLYQRLTTRLCSVLPHEAYKPHVTIAREISDHRIMLVKEKIAPYLPREKVVADTIDLITPLSDRRWVSVRTFPLSKDQ